MAYITYAAYQGLGGKLSAEVFEELIEPSGDVLDSMTNDFYQFKDLETDIPYRRDKFKKALVAQIAFFNENGATTVTGLQNFNTLTIGRTSISSGTGNNSSNSNNSYTALYSPNALMLLAPTGLLYRGLGGGSCGC